MNRQWETRLSAVALLLVLVFELCACTGHVAEADPEAQQSSAQPKDTESGQLYANGADASLTEPEADTEIPAILLVPEKKTRAEILSAIDFDAVKAAILAAEDLAQPTGAEDATLLSEFTDYAYSEAFCAVDLYRAEVYASGLDAELFAASVIKMSYVLWVCREIDAGQGSMEEVLSYLPRDHLGGTGVIQDMDRREYTVKECIHYVFSCSDNDAYSMLYHRFGTQGYNSFVTSCGAESLYLRTGSMWAYLTPRAVALLYTELLRYAASGEGYGDFLLDEMAASEDNWFREALSSLSEGEVPSKYGWVDGAFHVCTAVLDENCPVLLSVYTSGNRTEEDISFLKTFAADLFYHVRLWSLSTTPVSEDRDILEMAA